MNLKKIENDIKEEAKADCAAICDNDKSDELVERHINGISFGLWTLVALFLLATTIAIWHHSREKRERQRSQPEARSSAPINRKD